MSPFASLNLCLMGHQHAKPNPWPSPHSCRHSALGLTNRLQGDLHRSADTHNQSNMSDFETVVPVEADAPVPSACQVLKAELEKCVQEKGEDSCKDLLEAFQTLFAMSSALSPLISQHSLPYIALV
ncbi:hypothetical protein COCON_G00202030 [Conger conger]|uniref:Uncharacterized protein n=1 Tax=Conger conger TaxID=82655 RepID=A0A9Q1CZ27_CONCO|nr:hypothetical protein COCON_G00202030 [Conger conger]